MPLPQQLIVFISAFATGDDGAIHALRLNLSTGKLTTIHRTTDVQQPFFLALSPDNQFLYSIHAPNGFGGKEHDEIAAYKILDSEGKLGLLNRQSALGSAACYLDVDKTGKTLLVANYSTGSVASFPVRADGSLGKAATFVQHNGSSIDASRQEAPHAHCFVISPDNRFAYAADLGLDQLLGYKLTADQARVAPNQQAFVRTVPGSGPRHLIFHPQSHRVYVINELKNSVSCFDYDGASGVLVERQTVSTLPEEFDGTSYCADLKITPNGKYLYGTNRGHDSIVAYRIGDDGGLTRLAIEPSLGKGPQNLAITPNGAFLLCANMPGNNVVVFRIHPENGALSAVGEPLEIPMPSCIRVP